MGRWAQWGATRRRARRDGTAAPVLCAAVRDLRNAPAVRHQAAIALGRFADPRLTPELARLAAAEPDLVVRRALLDALPRAVAAVP